MSFLNGNKLLVENNFVKFYSRKLFLISLNLLKMFSTYE